MTHLSVLGSGAWGIALASKISNNHSKVVVWGRNEDTVAQINQRQHPKHPGKTFPQNIIATNHLEEAIEGAEALLLCLPSESLLSVLKKIPHIPVFFAWATKGFSVKGNLFSKEIKERFSKEGSFITGPSFAGDVVNNRPTAILIAGPYEQNNFWKNALHSEDFRPYTSADISGAQVGAALKNIIAIAVGICDGLSFGANAQAAIITRGLKEIDQLSTFFGGKKDTLYGLSGLGDVILTSMNNQSRNRRYGLSLTQKEELTELSEGKRASAIVHKITTKLSLDLPICEAVYQITHNHADPRKEAKNLLQRKLKEEK